MSAQKVAPSINVCLVKHGMVHFMWCTLMFIKDEEEVATYDNQLFTLNTICVDINDAQCSMPYILLFSVFLYYVLHGVT